MRITRKMVLHSLGDKCCRCGFADHRILQIDHVFGDGHHLSKIIQPNSQRFYKLVIQNPGGRFQLLCPNCNWLKRCERREHYRHVELIDQKTAQFHIYLTEEDAMRVRKVIPTNVRIAAWLRAQLLEVVRREEEILLTTLRGTGSSMRG
jgi:hypothetical protein